MQKHKQPLGCGSVSSCFPILSVSEQQGLFCSSVSLVFGDENDPFPFANESSGEELADASDVPVDDSVLDNDIFFFANESAGERVDASNVAVLERFAHSVIFSATVQCFQVLDGVAREFSSSIQILEAFRLTLILCEFWWICLRS